MNYRGFNSTMVRLKGTRPFRFIVVASPFQFHNGSIKRRGPKKAYISKNRFQFHNGSIKRTMGAGESIR